jgi:hypothetical protein
MRRQIATLQSQAKSPVTRALASFDKKAAALEGTPPQTGGGRGGRGRGGAPVDQPPGGRGTPAVPDTLWAVSGALGGMMNAMQAADVAPTMNTLNAVTAAQSNAARVMARWTALRTVDLPALNAQLTSAGLTTLALD